MMNVAAPRKSPPAPRHAGVVALALGLFTGALLSLGCETAAPARTPPVPVPTSAPSGAPAPATGGLAFGWKVPCRVPVQQVTEKETSNGRIRYMLGVDAAPDGNLNVSIQDLEFLEIDGEDVTSPEMQAQLAPAKALSSVIPVMIVSKSGQYMGTRGLEEAIERILQSLGPAKSEELREMTGKIMRSPKIKAALSAKVGDYWRTWVGAWVGVELSSGQALDRNEGVPFVDQEIPLRYHYEHRGPAKGAPGAVLLSMTATTLPGSGTVHTTADVWHDFAATMGLSLRDTPELDEVHYTVRLEADMEPAGLYPRRTRQETEIEVVVGSARRQAREMREDTFDWAHAVGCR